jgi:glyoxylase-like metal-dependent hydrolase (beta-lactamase superfamily II)
MPYLKRAPAWKALLLYLSLAPVRLPGLSIRSMVDLIDALHLGTANVISIALLRAGPGELVLVDTGPESVFDAVVAAMPKLGYEPRDVRHILASHIHLDHTGAAWRWARDFGAKIYVHPNGAPHLVDPSKLLASATRIYGDKMSYLWGAVEGIPKHQVVAATDSDLRLGDLRVRAINTPGHANHHNAYWIESQRVIFAGDVAGVRIGGGPTIPPFPPPDIHLELWRDSLEKIRVLQPASIYVTHFGEIKDPLASLDELEKRLNTWASWMKERMREGNSEAEIIPEFQRFVENELRTGGAGEEGIKTYEQADPASMSVAGLTRYWRKHHPEEISATG